MLKTITVDGTTYAQQDSDGCSDACAGYKSDLCHVLGDCEVGRRVWVAVDGEGGNDGVD
jgi:hypothetical protein